MLKNVIRTVVIGVALLASSTGLFANVTHAATRAGSFTPQSTIFNDPLDAAGTNENYKIVNYINKAINSTVKTSTIRLAMYSINIDSSADALIAAHKRGVNVQIITDDHATSTAQMIKIKKALSIKYTPAQTSFFKACDISCTSDHTSGGDPDDADYYRAYLHAKFIMFSSTSKSIDADTKFVTMVTSSNLTHTQALEGWNNLYTIVGYEPLYNFLKDEVFQKRLFTNDNIVNPYTTFETYEAGKDPLNKYKVYFYPKNEGSDMASYDPYLGILSNIRCSGAASGYGYDAGTTRRTNVRIAMFQWTEGRKYLAEKVVDLARDGCDVEVVISKNDTAPEILSILKTWVPNRPISLMDGDYNTPGTDTSDLERFIHNKYILVNGKYLDDTSSRLTFTGSPNFSVYALRYNNELALKIDEYATYEAFVANFRKTQDNSRDISGIDPN